jgi:galactonate dehydratase
MPDLPKCGGISEGRKIANMAEVYYIPLAPHNVSGPLGTIASCHVCASVPNFLVLEWHRLGDPNWEKLVFTEEPLIQEGYIILPDESGLGIELNEDFLRQLMPRGKLFE